MSNLWSISEKSKNGSFSVHVLIFSSSSISCTVKLIEEKSEKNSKEIKAAEKKKKKENTRKQTECAQIRYAFKIIISFSIQPKS